MSSATSRLELAGLIAPPEDVDEDESLEMRVIKTLEDWWAFAGETGMSGLDAPAPSQLPAVAIKDCIGLEWGGSCVTYWVVPPAGERVEHQASWLRGYHAGVRLGIELLG